MSIRIYPEMVYGEGVPAKFICSLDSFIEKRKQMEYIPIKKNKETLTEETIKACWDRYYRLEGKSNSKQR